MILQFNSYRRQKNFAYSSSPARAWISAPSAFNPARTDINDGVKSYMSTDWDGNDTMHGGGDVNANGVFRVLIALKNALKGFAYA